MTAPTSRRPDPRRRRINGEALNPFSLPIRELYRDIALADEAEWAARLDALSAADLREVQAAAGVCRDWLLSPHIEHAWTRRRCGRVPRDGKTT